jgi:N-acetylglucosamine kinase-like BadF-type ATPase
MLTLAFDLGKTRCRAALFDDDRRVAETEQPGSSGLADPNGVEDARQAITAASAQLRVTKAEAVCAGLAGLGRARQHAPALATGLAHTFGTDNIVLSSDITIAHAGALGGGPGVVIAAGTGSVALAINKAGDSALCDGWGYLLGDDGSGYAIGRAGLTAALREHDGRGGSPQLRRLAEQRFGPLEQLPSTIHQSDNPPQLIATFTSDVAAAARDGDPIATAIWKSAAQSLAATAVAAGNRVFSPNQPFNIATAGGLFDAGALLLEPFKDALRRAAPNAHLVTRQGDALDGARLLATRPDLPHHSLTLRPLADITSQPS